MSIRTCHKCGRQYIGGHRCIAQLVASTQEAAMDDRTLLELAAKAAGYAWTTLPGWSPESDQESGYRWNPLTDDGDALRLAVKLQLVVDFRQWGHDLADRVPGAYAWGVCHDAKNPCAASRRAIVLAAAEAGKATK